VTHFNPSYLKLFEIIHSTNFTEVLDFLTIYGEKFLGKTSVAARYSIIGTVVFTESKFIHLVKEMGLTIEEVDNWTGSGRPKSATFRTVDVVDQILWYMLPTESETTQMTSSTNCLNRQTSSINDGKQMAW
jgi:3-hydroxyacyl-CoA dehydrogenase